MIMARSFEEVRDEGAAEIAEDTMPTKEPSANELKAQQAAEKFAIESRREHQERIDAKRDQLMEDLGKVYDEALAEVMMRDDYSTDTPAGAAFYKTATEQKNRIIIELLDEAVAKNLDENDIPLMEARMKDIIGG